MMDSESVPSRHESVQTTCPMVQGGNRNSKSETEQDMFAWAEGFLEIGPLPEPAIMTDKLILLLEPERKCVTLTKVFEHVACSCWRLEVLKSISTNYSRGDDVIQWLNSEEYGSKWLVVSLATAPAVSGGVLGSSSPRNAME